MGNYWKAKLGQSKKDVILTTAINTAALAADELALWVGTGVAVNKPLPRDTAVEVLRDAVREDGFKAPAGGVGTELKIAQIETGQASSKAAIADGAQAFADESKVAILYGATFPRALGSGATLLFDLTIEEIHKACLEAGKKF